MYFDWTYVVFVIPMLIISLIAQTKVKTTYNKYSKVFSKRELTADKAARAILDANGLYNVKIGRIPGELTDNYNPKDETIYLSDRTFGNNSVAAIGVAAHESGHAIQHAVGYTPIKIRSAIVPVTQIGSKLSTPLILLGLILSIYPLAYAGIVLFGTVVLFQLVTLPTEFNASHRALEILENGYLYEDEVKDAKKVLSAAAMTYVAAMLSSLASLLRLILIVMGNSGRRRR